jgi:transmembrane sensor
MNSPEETKFVHFGPHFKKFAIGAAIFWTTIFLVYFIFIKEPAYKQFATQNQTLEKTLEDSSSVFMNYNSFLAIPEKFSNKERKVKLDGEAYFKVKMNKKKPFVVLVNDLKISSLDGEFNIKNDSTNVIVTVAEGKAKVEKSVDEFVILHYGQEVNYNREAYTFTRNIHADGHAFSYYNKIFYFKNNDLYDVTTILSNAFHEKVIVENSEIIDLTISKKFENQNLETILNEIAKDLNISWKNENELYLLYKKAIN